MTKEVKGVFVRLPLSEAQVESVLNSYTGDKESTNICIQKTILDLGTPVTGKNLDCAVIIEQDDKRYMPEVVSYQPYLVKPKKPLNLVLQSDAQAHIAALEAYVARLRTEDDKALTQVIEERDECEQVINDLYQAVMGYPPEWSNNFGYRDAVKDVVDYVHALRTEALKGGAA